jgi:hypothetical protein
MSFSGITAPLRVSSTRSNVQLNSLASVWMASTIWYFDILSMLLLRVHHHINAGGKTLAIPARFYDAQYYLIFPADIRLNLCSDRNMVKAVRESGGAIRYKPESKSQYNKDYCKGYVVFHSILLS